MPWDFDVYARRPGGEWDHVACSATPFPPLSPCALEGYERWQVVVAGAEADGHPLDKYDVDSYYQFLAPADDDVPPGGTLEQHDIVLEWGNYRCIESSFRYVSLCGRDLRGTADRIVYQPAHDGDDPHASKCFDCLVVAGGGSVHPRRRELHFSSS